MLSLRGSLANYVFKLVLERNSKEDSIPSRSSLTNHPTFTHCKNRKIMNDFLIFSSERINQTETVDKAHLHNKKKNPSYFDEGKEN